MSDVDYPIHILNIHRAIVEADPYPDRPTFLHAEVDVGYISPSVYKVLDDQILYLDVALDPICEALVEFWRDKAKGERWEEIHCLFHDGKFDITYVYPDEIDREEGLLDRRERLVHEYLGDKPVIYLPSVDDDWPSYRL